MSMSILVRFCFGICIHLDLVEYMDIIDTPESGK